MHFAAKLESKIKGQLGVPVTVPIVFTVFSKDSWGIITHKYLLYMAYIGICHRGTLGSGYIQLSPGKKTENLFPSKSSNLKNLKVSTNIIPKLGGGFKYFLFSPLLGEDFHLDEYFSRGLKPPTIVLVLTGIR